MCYIEYNILRSEAGEALNFIQYLRCIGVGIDNRSTGHLKVYQVACAHGQPHFRCPESVIQYIHVHVCTIQYMSIIMGVMVDQKLQLNLFCRHQGTFRTREVRRGFERGRKAPFVPRPENFSKFWGFRALSDLPGSEFGLFWGPGLSRKITLLPHLLNILNPEFIWVSLSRAGKIAVKCPFF